MNVLKKTPRQIFVFSMGVIICMVLPVLAQFSLDLLFGVTFFSRNLLLELPLLPNKERSSAFVSPKSDGPLMLELEMTMNPQDLGNEGVDALNTPFKWSYRFINPKGEQPYLGVTAPVRALTRGTVRQELESGMTRITARELLHRHIPSNRLRLEATVHDAQGRFLENAIIRVYDHVDASSIRLALLATMVLTILGPLLLVVGFCWSLISAHGLRSHEEAKQTLR